MNAEKTTSDQQVMSDATDSHRSVEQEGVWQQIQQHFQTTQTSLSLRLVCEGKVVQQIGDVKSGVKEAARLFNLQNSPQKAEELIASQENLFNRKCQQWEQVARGAEARERARATGGEKGTATSAGNRRKLESEHNGIRNRITNVKQCIRRLRTALNRGVSLEIQENASEEITTDQDGSQSAQEVVKDEKSEDVADSRLEEPGESAESETEQLKSQESKFAVCFQDLIGDGVQLDYESAPYLDPFSDEGFKSRESIWTGEQPFCLIVQWEDSPSGLLNMRFWIVPKRPEFVEELRSEDLPSLFLHLNQSNAAEKLNFELVVHSSQNGPLSSEMNQLFNRIESERFLQSEQKIPLSYLTCTIETQSKFDLATNQPTLLELL